MRHKIISGLMLAGGMVLSTGALAETASPMMLAQTCAACHGTNGNSVGITPTLAGAPAEYFVETMQAFKNGDRKATVMDRVAKGYSDAEIEAMGNYFAAQKNMSITQPFDAGMAAKGRDLHEEYCEKCHEDGGRTSEDGGVLSGQSMEYLKFAMEDFHNGDRDAPKKMQKRVEAVVEDSGSAGIEALIHYYGSQQ